MVMYSDRGLVKNGIISKLFEYLYMTFVLTVKLWGLAVCFVDYSSNKHHHERHLLTQICLNNDVISIYKSVALRVSITSFIFLIIYSFMYSKVKRFVRSKSKGGKVPEIFGRYQRNIITYEQTLIIAFLLFPIDIRLPLIGLLKKMNVIFNEKHVIIISNIISSLVFGFVIPLKIVMSIKNHIPGFYSNNGENKREVTFFYVSEPSFEPRRPENVVYFQHKMINPKRTSRKFRYLSDFNSRSKFTEMPIIVE